MQAAPPQRRPVLKELTCPNCSSPLSQYTPDAQTLVCGKCGSYVAVGMDDPTLLAKGAKFPPPPVPIKVGQTFTLEGVPYFVMGRVMYRGWDPEDSTDYWLWNEWLMGAQDGRLLWLAYDKEDGFVLYTKLRFRPGAEFNAQVSSFIPLAEGKKAPVDERYPANIVGAEGELTWQAKRGDRLQMVEATGAEGKQYSMQVTADEIELHEGRKVPETAVATALNDQPWLERIKQTAEGKKTRDYIGIVCLIFAAIGLIAGIAVSSTGEQILAPQSVTIDPANPVALFTVELDQANRPAIIKGRMQTNLPPNTFIDIDASVTSPNEVETIIFDQEVYHETGSDDEGPWTETSLEVGDMFVPYLAGTHHIEVSLTGSDLAGNVVPLPGALTVQVEVYRNHIMPSWLIGYGAIVGIIGIVLMLSGGGVSMKTMLIIAIPIVILLVLIVMGFDFGDLISGLLDILSEA